MAKAWELLLKPENNFLRNFSKADFLKIRKLIIELVLATDLSQHNQLLSSFREKVYQNMLIFKLLLYMFIWIMIINIYLISDFFL